SHDRSHRTERVEHATVAVDTFIGRLVQPTMPKGGKRLRYDGVQATKTFAKMQGVMRAALAQGAGVVKGAVKSIARLTYRQRYEQSTGRDPFRCPPCGKAMAVWRLWHPTYDRTHSSAPVRGQRACAAASACGDARAAGGRLRRRGRRGAPPRSLGMRFQGAMAGVEEADDRPGDIPRERLGPRRQAERIVLAPDREEGGLVRA